MALHKSEYNRYTSISPLDVRPQHLLNSHQRPTTTVSPFVDNTATSNSGNVLQQFEKHDMAQTTTTSPLCEFFLSNSKYSFILHIPLCIFSLLIQQNVSNFQPDESTESIKNYADMDTIAEKVGLPLWGEVAIMILVCLVIFVVGFFTIRWYCRKRHHGYSPSDVKATQLLG